MIIVKNNIKVLITGSNGLLGKGLIKTAPKNVKMLLTHYKSEEKNLNSTYVDITNKNNVGKVLNFFKPDFVIHAASMGSVDLCEKNRKRAFNVNVEGTRNIINASKKINAHLVFISSNAVFDGLNAPYNERSVRNPVNYYGKTKVFSEDDIMTLLDDFTIVRLVLMYGWNNSGSRQNPVTWLLEQLSKNEKVKLVNDTYVNPIYNMHAAEIIWKIIKNKRSGIFHVAGKTKVNRFSFGLLTAEIFSKNKALIEAVDSSFFSSLAKRMPDTTYDLTKIKTVLGVEPLSLKLGLKKMLMNNI